MTVPATRFLGSPAKIRSALNRIAKGASQLDLAVAFVGSDWNSIIGTVAEPVRLVCWLSSTNTNPYAVRQMMQRKNVEVRRIDRMHAKVYFAHGEIPAAIIGSANLSIAALAEDDGIGQYEAAMLTHNANVCVKIHAWFETLWGAADKISDDDLAQAIKSWKAAHKGAGSKKPNGQRTPIPATLTALADAVRDLDIEDWPEFEEEWSYLAKMVPGALTKKGVKTVVGFVQKWSGYDYTFAPAMAAPLSDVRAAFSVAFDEGRGVQDRLKDLDTGGDLKIAGLGLASWTLVLQWRSPLEYPPFNKRTRKFLENFDLAPELRDKVLTPRVYADWVDFAQELALALNLPAAGYVDRMVWEHTKPDA